MNDATSDEMRAMAQDRPAAPQVERALKAVQRYNLGTNSRWMEPSDDGEWVRFKDVKTAFAARSGARGEQ